MNGVQPNDPATWTPVLVRCPRCSKTVVPESGLQHVEEHLMWRVGEYIDANGDFIEGRKNAVAMYVGSGRAMFFDEKQMRYIGYQRRTA